MEPDWLTDLGEPEEDAGALTQSRFHYQCECIIAVCIAMLVEDNIESVICEWHEDYIILYKDQSIELVSVKHREPQKGPWSFAELCDRGGLLHLFRRWQRVRERAVCRISTNAGLKLGVNEAQDFAEACARFQDNNQRDERLIEDYASRIALMVLEQSQKLDPNAPDGSKKPKSRRSAAKSIQLTLDHEADPVFLGLRNEVQRFLARLQIEHGLPHRQYIRSHNIVKVMSPTLSRMGRDSSDAEACYESILPIIQRANRDHDSQHRSLASYIANPRRLSWDNQLLERIGRRTLKRQEIMNALTTKHAKGVRLTSEAIVNHRENLRPASRLVRKLQEGGLGPTAIHTATNLRSLWLEAWAELRTDLPGDAAELSDLKIRVSHLAARAESETRHAGKYGTAMNQRLGELLHPEALGRVPPMMLDPLHLLGLAYELCDECVIWFSEVFEFGQSHEAS
ncbi:dsDNA nuclease domain-containing protein [Streptosporangium sp. 'caverna']|uniref:dsDNA nuclease domain-containing protein n=1 Tax=Streptosporangium sp. 'caverna' TaxID=2202249 RepID=UPI0013A6A5C7|nr:dsDNA nuclease domain-containing protein [Streptosporangium sp. 'caverna']